MSGSPFPSWLGKAFSVIGFVASPRQFFRDRKELKELEAAQRAKQGKDGK